LNDEQKSLLQDLARVCHFKATSDLPQWLKPEEREDLRSFLTASPEIKQLSRYVFLVDGRTVDFSSAVSLPEQAKGLDIIKGAITGWLGNQSWALKTLDGIQKDALKNKVNDL
jgi:hypothetical protein